MANNAWLVEEKAVMFSVCLMHRNHSEVVAGNEFLVFKLLSSMFIQYVQMKVINEKGENKNLS